MNQSEIREILDRLKKEYPDAECALEHRNVYELIVSVVLSAQTTDVSVNNVTRSTSEGKGLFDIYPAPEQLAAARQEDVMEIIKTIGMYKTKSKNIINLAKALCEKHGGQVPEDYNALVGLPGVGRKTANVVLSVGFGHQRIAVDTHVFRVSRRIGLAEGEAKSAKSAGATEVLATEYVLMDVLPKERWSEAHHSLIWHGRQCCTARNPRCQTCVIGNICRKNGVE